MALLTGNPVQGSAAEVDDVGLEAAGQWRLVWLKFRRHRLALASLVILAMFYGVAAFCEFFAPTTTPTFWREYVYAPPQRIRLVHDGAFLLHVNGYKFERDPRSYAKTWTVDPDTTIPIGFFVKGEPYRLWGVFPGDRHFIGPTERGQPFFLWGSDKSGRDIFSRNIYSSRISLTIGLVGVAFSLVLGILFGGLSGLVGGWVDNVVQRLVEIFMSIPQLPIWIALSAMVPLAWSPTRVYFVTSLIVSALGWTWMARVVRSKFLSLREEDFVLAARLDGCSRLRLVFKHMLPSFYSHIIASLTLAVPGMIIGETALSFLGLGLRAPVVSWGVLLRDTQQVAVLATSPWLLLPALSVVVVVLAFNFMGDGLRDAADPYAQ